MNDIIKKKFDEYKKEYESVNMSDIAYMQMKARMDQARKEKRFMKTYNKYVGGVIAAVLALAIIITPNTSASAAEAMGSIPVIGEFFKIITIRDYTYDDGKRSAQITTPKIFTKNERLKKSTDEINREIQEIIAKYENEFKKSMEKEGYKDVVVRSEVVNTTDKYFTLKLTCHETSASSSEVDYYYSIDLSTGKGLQLKDLFTAGTDYETAISENINMQMRNQIKNDENIAYWIDDKDMPDWNFKELRDQSSFYINKDGKLVICFNQGDVAPMYMGEVEFIIEDDVFPNSTILY